MAENKSGNANIHLYCGDDEYQVSHAVRECVNALCPVDQQALGLDIIDGAVNSAAEATDAVTKCLGSLRTVGFFGGRKVTWLRDVNFIGETQTGKAKEVKDRVAVLSAEIKKGLQPDQILVISAGKVDKRSVFFKACQSAGAVTVFAMPDKAYKAEEQARGTAAGAFRDAGLQIKSEVLEPFLSKTGIETRQIVQEIEKLAVYMGGRREVTVNDVENIVSASRESVAWDLADAVGTGDLIKSLTILRQLVFQKESEVGIVILLERRVRDLLLFRTCLDKGWLSLQGSPKWVKLQWGSDPDIDKQLSQIENDPRSMNPFRAGRLGHQASTHSVKRLLRWQAEVGRAHEAMVSSGLPPSLILENVILRMLGSTQKSAVVR
ncbi:MAG: DNA polymerase III subunit delta [Verrucomicrobia bacterium]|nr:DNA polymerase III subunit delta [Verrucomicrobiota bacterium]